MRALSIILSIAVAACASPAGRRFETTLVHVSPDNPAGDYPVKVVLGDETGLVTGIEPITLDPSYSLELAIEQDADDPTAIIAKWLGGACDGDDSLSFQASDAGYALHLEAHARFGSCPAVGILRSVRIKLSQAVPLGSITVSGKG